MNESIMVPHLTAPSPQSQTGFRGVFGINTVIKKAVKRFDRGGYRLMQLAAAGGLRGTAAELVLFGVKQAWACLFGAGMLVLLVLTHFWYPETVLYRYDFLFLAALTIQGLLLRLRLETWREAKVIFLFHIVATLMELFKTSAHIGSWTYPEDSYIRLLTVPLFAGFMYSAVGSYIARVWKILHFRFTNYPPHWMAAVLAVLIYVNFFTHHFMMDLRPALFVAVALLFARTRIYFTVTGKERHMPLLLGFFLVALFIWVGENIGSFTHTWLYPHQLNGWRWVSFGKMGAWFLLIIISFVMVSWLHLRCDNREVPASAPAV